MSRKSSRRQSLVSILIKSSENVGLRLLSDEVKKAHKQQAEVINTRHQSEMELLADLVTFMRIKGKLLRVYHFKAFNFILVKLVAVVNPMKDMLKFSKYLAIGVYAD